MRRVLIPAIIVACLGLVAVLYMPLLSAPQKGAEVERFVVPLDASTPDAISKLKSEGFIKSSFGFGLALSFKGGSIEPGGYKISKSMNAFEVAKVLTTPPYMKWIVIPEGKRKEEIAELLAKELNWTDAQKGNWIKKDTALDLDHTEGVYFPDTYLIPVDESPADTASRLRAKFEEKFALFAAEALKQNIRWPVLLTLASLLERESGGKDMPIISGVIWNRLDKNMKLDIDATLQYIRGEPGDWWPTVVSADKKLNSKYNTYLYKGLPPHPIANPGLAAIDAALHPATTTCLYYLHDSTGLIHCANSYEEHKANIEKYL